MLSIDEAIKLSKLKGLMPSFKAPPFDPSRRNFGKAAGKGLMAAAVGSALQKERAKGRKPDKITGSGAIKNVMAAGEKGAAFKHSHEMAGGVKKALDSKIGQKFVNRSSGLQSIRDRAANIEKKLDPAIKTADKIADNAKMSRRQFLTKTGTVVGSGTRKYMNYKLGTAKKLGTMLSPYPSALTRSLYGVKKGVLTASKEQSVRYLDNLENLGEYI